MIARLERLHAHQHRNRLVFCQNRGFLHQSTSDSAVTVPYLGVSSVGMKMEQM